MRRRNSFKYILLFILLVCSIYFCNNSAYVFSRIGRLCYLNHNVEKAHFFYDKALGQGYNDEKVRLEYLEVLMNAPLTISIQENLVQIAEDDINDEATKKAKDYIAGIREDINTKFPDNYIKQSLFNGMVVHWHSFPISYSFKNKEIASDNIVREIRSAFLEWEKTGKVSFNEVENSDANIVINFISNTANNKVEYGRKYVVAYTAPEIVASDLESMNIFLNLNNVDGESFSANQIYNTALHEIFHALGFMGHCYDSKNIMYMSKNVNSVINDTRAKLTDADIVTLELLYSIKPDITNGKKGEGKYLPYVVLGDDEEQISSKYNEAKNYVRNAPSLPGGYIDLAESFVAKRQFDKAIRSLKFALNLADSKNMKHIIYYDLAVSYFELTDYEVALNYVNKAMQYSENDESHLLKAEILYKLGSDEAKEEYMYLINNNPENVSYVKRLANIYIKESKFLQARKVLKTFVNINPDMKKDESLSSYGLLLW